MKYLILVLALAGCAPVLTTQDKLEIANDAAKIAICQNEGRACKAGNGTDCYAKYDACMKEVGLR